MKGIVQSISNIPYNEKAFTWIKLISIIGGTQLIVQIVGFASGIIVIRLLPAHEYGLYTLANTMLGTMLVLADGGISSGVLSQGGKVWKNKKELGIVLATGLELRKKFAMVSLLIAVPILFYLLRLNNASWLMSVLIVVSLIPAFFTSLSGTILQVAPRLSQDIAPLQKNNIISNVMRLSLTMITLFAFPWAFVAVLGTGLAQLWTNKNLKKISSGYADWKQSPDPVIRKEILTFVKRILPGSVYYCLSRQITIWLISIFGVASTIAQAGALSRIAMTLSIIGAIVNAFVLPRYARLPNEKNKLFYNFFQIQLALFFLGGVILSVVYLFPSQILWILGKDYSYLKNEFLLIMAGSCLGLLSGASFGICSSRGWAINPLISIPLSIAAIVSGILLIDISTLMGILKFNLFIYLVEVIMYFVYCLQKIWKITPYTGSNI